MKRLERKLLDKLLEMPPEELKRKYNLTYEQILEKLNMLIHEEILTYDKGRENDR